MDGNLCIILQQAYNIIIVIIIFIINVIVLIFVIVIITIIGGGCPEGSTSVRRVDRIYHKDVQTICGKEYLVLSISGDLFMRGQIRHLIGLLLGYYHFYRHHHNYYYYYYYYYHYYY